MQTTIRTTQQKWPNVITFVEWNESRGVYKIVYPAVFFNSVSMDIDALKFWRTHDHPK